MVTMTYPNCENCIHNEVCSKKQELLDFVGEVKPLVDMRCHINDFVLNITCKNHKMEKPTIRNVF